MDRQIAIHWELIGSASVSYIFMSIRMGVHSRYTAIVNSTSVILDAFIAPKESWLMGSLGCMIHTFCCGVYSDMDIWLWDSIALNQNLCLC